MQHSGGLHLQGHAGDRPAAVGRHHPGRPLGRRLLGTVLGVGSQGGLGADCVAWVFGGAACPERGFGEEFRQLRFSPAVAGVLALIAVGVASLGVEYRTWAVIAVMPLNFAGLALVHARVKARGQGTGWLTGFYLAWLLFDPVKMIVVFGAIADSWFDFRQRWQQPPDTN